MTAYIIRKKNRLRVSFSLLSAVMVMTACIGGAGISIAAGNDCEKLLSQEALKKIDKAKIKQIQDSLKATGYYTKKSDELIGQYTEAALKGFCTDFSDQFRKGSIDDFMATLFLYAAIAKEYPAWKEIALSRDFKKWINKQSAEKRARIYKIRETGTPQQIISLYERFNADRKKPEVEISKQEDVEISKPEFDRTDEYIASFELTEQDFEQLKAEDDIIGKLDKLKDKPYDNKDEFVKALRKAVKPITEQFKRYEGLIVKSALLQATYTLTKSSFQKLKKGNIPNSVIADLQILQHTEYPNKNEFMKTVQPIVDGINDQLNQYQPSIMESAKVAGAYRVNEEFLRRLRRKGIPPDLIEKLKALPDKPFADKNEFKKVVRPIIEDVTIEYNFPDVILSVLIELKKEGIESQRAEAKKIIKQVIEQYNVYQQIILKGIEGLPAYMLTTLSYAKLKDGGVPDYINSTLRKLQNKGYSDKNLFENALKDQIAGLTGQYRTEILESAEKLTIYKLTGLSLKKLQDELKTKKIPEGVTKVLEELKGVDYAGQNLLKRAVVSKINGLYLSLAVKLAKDQETYNLTDLYLKQLQDELQAKKIPDGLVEKLSDLEGMKSADKDLFKNMLDPKIEAFTAELAYDQDYIVENAKEKHRFNQKKINPQSIEWKGAPCGCVLDELAGTEIYGFYPFWLTGDGAGEQKSDNAEGQNAGQQLNFSVLSRIGYYALPIDEKGDLKLTDDWKIKGDAAFIEEAHKYRTKVDLVVYNLDWEKWHKAAELDSAELDKITKTIVKLVKPKKAGTLDWVKFLLTTLPWNWMATYDRIGVVADGVTIDFDGFPAEPAGEKIFVKLIREFRKKLHETWQGHYLNILFPASAIGKGIYSFENLTEIVGDADENENGKLFFLVFLDEPTTKTKKSLRRKIEDNLHGEQRMNVLRKIVPIITYAGADKSQPDHAETYQQLLDDIIYCKDNFGGIGFWPLPIVQDPGKNDVNQAVKEVFAVKDAEKGIFRKVISDACVVICPNRWIFRISLDLLMVILIVFGVLYLLNCKIRNVFNSARKYFWILLGFIVLLILLVFALFYCDPYYQNLREGNVPLFLVVILFIAIWVRRYYANIRRTSNP